MILFFSDMHFGRGSRDVQRSSEADLIACLRSLDDVVERLYLMGDVFDQFIEYPTLVPKGFVRFQALLAEWTDRGVPVTYLVGNHDPWHEDYFEQELGVRVVYEACVESLRGTTVHLAHGDGVAPAERLYRRLKPLLRHPVPVWLYRTLLPGDTGFRLARWYNRRFGGREHNPAVRHALQEHARRILADTPAEVVILGHSHVAERCVWPEGTYLNPGCWHEARTFGAWDREGPVVLRWNGCRAEVVDPAHVTLSRG